jgi:hypothetical protein
VGGVAWLLLKLGKEIGGQFRKKEIGGKKYQHVNNHSIFHIIKERFAQKSYPETIDNR